MLVRFQRHALAALAALAAGALMAGCTARENARTDTTSSAGAIADSGVGASGTVSHHGWTDGEILAYTIAANSGEVGEARVAERKATNAAVKKYAQQIARDHQALLDESTAFAKQHTIMPDTTQDAVADLMKGAHDEIQDLSNKPAGRDFDADYIDKQIDGHKDVLDKLKDAESATTNPQLKTMLTKTIGKVQEHLTKAEDIKQNQLKS
ncbi:MAG TPA: DUF4142 domain-containing protein [Gemmatimonadaceae bacterium]|nr:DUF4142 domain-containing protein [Gemmatimonadaceae bacterium]